MGAADRGGAATRKDAAQGAATDHCGHLLAAPEWGDLAGHPGRARPVVAAKSQGDLHVAAQLFIRWAGLGAWERLLELAQERAGGLELGLAFLDGMNIRAHAKAAGAPKKGDLQKAETSVKRLVALAAASAPRPSRWRTPAVAP